MTVDISFEKNIRFAKEDIKVYRISKINIHNAEIEGLSIGDTINNIKYSISRGENIDKAFIKSEHEVVFDEHCFDYLINVQNFKQGKFVKWDYRWVIIKCTIPKGTQYIKGYRGKYISCIPSTLIIDEIITDWRQYIEEEKRLMINLSNKVLS